MRELRRVTGRVAVIDRANVDTDQIIPKQFLKWIERSGYGEFLFYDWMKDPAFELRRPRQRYTQPEKDHKAQELGEREGDRLKPGHRTGRGPSEALYSESPFFFAVRFLPACQRPGKLAAFVLSHPVAPKVFGAR